MATWKCKACENEVDTEERRCPSCGADHPKPMRNLGIGFLILVGFIIFLIANTPHYSSTENIAQKTSSASADDKVSPISSIHHVKPKCAACLTEDALKKLVIFSSQKDSTAVDQLFSGLDCFPYPANTPVYIMERKIGRVKIRKEGITEGAWTISECID